MGILNPSHVAQAEDLPTKKTEKKAKQEDKELVKDVKKKKKVQAEEEKEQEEAGSSDESEKEAPRKKQKVKQEAKQDKTDKTLEKLKAVCKQAGIRPGPNIYKVGKRPTCANGFWTDGCTTAAVERPVGAAGAHGC